MPRLVVLVIAFSAFSVAYSQRTLSENIWTSLVFRYKTPRFQVTGDMGYRMCDNYIHSKRTILARLTIEKSFKNNSLGLGYAYFEHYINSQSTENRLFVEYSRQFDLERRNFNLRLRNELRTFNDRRTTNRIRIQGTFCRELTKQIEARLSSEIFYTPGKQALIEQRYSTGLIWKFHQLFTIIPFYTLQWQSNVPYPQHIFGTQFQVSLEH
jgi:hypothetical protein